MPITYEKHGIRFSYPENWQLEELQVDDAEAVTVASPEGAFWTVSIHPPDQDVEHVAQAVLQGVRSEFDDVEVDEATDELCGQELLGYNLSFFCHHLVTTAQIRGFRTLARTYVVLWQAEDQELRKVQEIFQAITASMIRSARQSDE